MIDVRAAMAAIQPGGVACRSCRVAIDSHPIPTAAPTSDTPMTTAIRVSMRPWPNGWLSSGGRDQNRDPAYTKMTVNTSRKASMPSAMTAWLSP